MLANGTVFKPQSKTLGEALLEPSGIAVDPTSHDIVVMAKEDRGESFEPSLRIALERITSSGSKGARYVDSKTAAFFEEGEEATSPAVSASGKVYAVGGSLENLQGATVQEIDEIPSNFSSSEAPRDFVEYDPGLNELVTFPGIPVPNEGAGLSIAPNGDFYAYAKVRHQGGAKTFAPGVLIFGSSGAELGWTGGQTAQGGPKCAISFLGHPMIAAGKEERVFVFDSNPEAPQVVELGPGGEGCPAATSSELAATVNGSAVIEPVAPEVEVKFASTLTEANALSVKWNFGDGEEVETQDEHQAPEVVHKFASEGQFKVTETIRTDNLQSPEFVEEKTVVVKGSVPVARFSGPGAALVGEAVSFDGKNSTDPNGLALTYSWEFGDGGSEKTSVSKVLHTYTASGEYHVKLTVKDSKGQESAPVTHVIVVSVKEEAKEPLKEEPKQQLKEESKPPPKELPKSQPPLTYELTISGSTVAVAPSGSLTLTLDCAGASSCAKGTISLRTLKPVGTGKHKSLLTLASGPLNLSGGHAARLSLHLSGKARALLAHLHVLRARVTVLAYDTTGSAHTTTFTVTLRAGKAHGRH
ncbi:MAG TPA: PKD domain-containing protein [Solirubrobacteraceae bacterium]|nr:PKD domain-containing protein [Solirubrobacteraceae bacterium]